MTSPSSLNPTRAVYGVVLRDLERSLGDADLLPAALLAIGLALHLALAAWRPFRRASRAWGGRGERSGLASHLR